MRMRWRWMMVCCLLVATAAQGDETRTAREAYNAALEQYQGQTYDGAMEGFLEARDRAGGDDELRYRAAFNLGMTLAARAEVVRAEDPEAARDLYLQAATWFRDAVNISPNEVDARYNLEIIQRRILALTEELNRGQNTLEKRLARLIGDERELRGAIRGLLREVEAAGVAAGPTSYAERFRALASQQRALLAEANDIFTMASEEHTLIDQKPEDNRTEQEAMRHFQLDRLMAHMDRGRNHILDARRGLRKLDAERGHRETAAALRALKRASEALADPLVILRTVAQEQALLFRQSKQVSDARATVTGDIELPAWLHEAYLAEQQHDLGERAAEVGMWLAAGVAAKAQDPAQAASGAGADPRQQRVLEAAGEALPFVQEAARAMAEAKTALDAEQAADAVDAERKALEALAEAIERFSELKGLVELAFLTQAQAVQQLTPEGPDATVALDADKIAELREGIVHNRRRLEQMHGLIADELQVIAGQRAQLAQQDPSQPADPKASEQLDAMQQKFELAEQLRGRALMSLERYQKALDEVEALAAAVPPETDLVPLNPDGQGSSMLDPSPDPQTDDPGSSMLDPSPDVLGPAEASLEDLRQLRMIFFTLVEHLKELARSQAETADETAAAVSLEEVEEQLRQAGILSATQTQHKTLADALAQGLREQAAQPVDAAGMDPQQAKQMKEAAARMELAAGEVETASVAMQDAVDALSEESAPQLEPGHLKQEEALEHLYAAIELLEPPQEQNKKQQDQQQQQQQQQQAQKRQTDQRLQAAREREKERRRKKAAGAPGGQPVEKDW